MKYLEEATATIISYPTATTSKSLSASFVDVSRYNNVILETMLHRLPDQKGEGVVTATIYEHTASTWAGVATAVTASIVTGTINSVSDLLLQSELRAPQLSCNNSKRYVNAYLTLPTSVQICATVTRFGPSFEPQS